MATQRWVSYLVDGKPSEAVKRATDKASGAYAIRRKDSGGVVYVGESDLGHMWRTLARHFQAPDSFKRPKPKGGGATFAVDRAGAAAYEVTWQITSRGKRARGAGDQKAMALQALWIAKYRKAGHRLHNVEDGLRAETSKERRARAARAKHAASSAPEDPWGGMLNPQGAMTELGRLTRLSARKGRTCVELAWSLRNAPVLAYDAAKRLHVVYLGPVVRASTPEEIREYERTHWGARSSAKVRRGGVAVGPWTPIGVGVSITYTTRKGLDASPVDYVHPWGEGGPKAFTAPRIVAHRCAGGCAKRCRAAGSIALCGGSYSVGERGIVG